MLEAPERHSTNPHSVSAAPGISSLAGDAVARLLRLYEEFGPVARFEESGRAIVFVSGPELNQKVLSDTQTFHSCFAPLRGPRTSAQRRLTSGLITMNGEEHRRHRRRLMPSFSRPSIAGYYDSIVKLVEKSLAEWRIGQVRSVDREMIDLMLKVTSTLLFGMDDQGMGLELGRLIDRWMSLQHDLGLASLVPDTEATARYDELLDLAEGVESKLQQIVDFRMQRRDSGTDVLSRLLAGRKEGSLISDEQVIGHAALLFGAAHMTSAHTLTWTLVLAALHPRLVDRVATELHELLGDRTPNLEEMEELKTLDAFIKESMRILPASAYSQRIVARRTRLDKHRVEPGTIVVFSPLITHRIAGLYAEPKSFRPKRWQQSDPPPFAYIPFGGGPRLCLGGALAPIVFKMFFAGAFRRFSPAVDRRSRFDAGLQATMLVPKGSIDLRLCRLGQAPLPKEIPGNVARMIDLPR